MRARLGDEVLRAGRERASSRCSARSAEVLDRFPGARDRGHAPTSRRSRSSPAEEYGERGHTVLAGRLRQRRGRHRAGAHRDRVRRGRLPPRRAVRAERRQPGAAGRHLRRAHRPVRRALREGRRPGPDRRPRGSAAACCRAEQYEHAYPHCWRCDTPLLYYAKASWYIRTTARARRAAGGQRGDRVVPVPHQARALRQVAREQRRLGAVARALLGHAAAGLALRGGARPLRRLDRRAARAGRADVPDDLHRPYIDEVDVPVPRVRRARCGACRR